MAAFRDVRAWHHSGPHEGWQIGYAMPMGDKVRLWDRAWCLNGGVECHEGMALDCTMTTGDIAGRLDMFGRATIDLVATD